MRTWKQNGTLDYIIYSGCAVVVVGTGVLSVRRLVETYASNTIIVTLKCVVVLLLLLAAASAVPQTTAESVEAKSARGRCREPGGKFLQ